jgi:hypothetical protein
MRFARTLTTFTSPATTCAKQLASSSGEARSPTIYNLISELDVDMRHRIRHTGMFQRSRSARKSFVPLPLSSSK